MCVSPKDKGRNPVQSPSAALPREAQIVLLASIWKPHVRDISVYDISVYDISAYDIFVYDISVHGISVYDISVYDISVYDVSVLEPDTACNQTRRVTRYGRVIDIDIMDVCVSTCLCVCASVPPCVCASECVALCVRVRVCSYIRIVIPLGFHGRIK